jgi:hypothetical protein
MPVGHVQAAAGPRQAAPHPWPHTQPCTLRCRYVKQLMADAGLDVREDAMGNIFGRWQVLVVTLRLHEHFGAMVAGAPSQDSHTCSAGGSAWSLAAAERLGVRRCDCHLAELLTRNPCSP